MKILFLAWKDIQHPLAGGAEVVLHELAKRLVADGHKVTILTAEYKDAPQKDTIDNIEIIRVGKNRYLHAFQATLYYRKHLRNKFDAVVETVNTAPYFHVITKDKAKSYLFYHQLARQIWFHEAPKPIGVFGYAILEPLATFILGKTKTKTITISNSTKKDLVKFGFAPENIKIITQGMQLNPVKDLEEVEKADAPTVLSLGSLRPMKRTLDQVKAFEAAKSKIPQLQMKIAGDANSDYGREVLDYINNSKFKKDIHYLGRVSNQQKIALMREAHVITVTSIKEGWGLIVTEAASQGTPAVVYNVDGLRDSVKDQQTGLVTETSPEALADGVIQALQNRQLYQRMQQAAWQWSKEINFDQSYKDFITTVKENHETNRLSTAN